MLRKILVVACLWSSASALGTPALDAVLADPEADAQALGLAVAEAADASDAGFSDSRAELRMVLHDSRGNSSERALRILTLEGQGDDGDRSLVLFDSPPDQRGTALLTWNHDDVDDDQWLFLPALQRVKKIAARNRSGPFVGSEFAFEDLTSDQVSAFRWSYEGIEDCELGRCYRVERRPVERWSGYTRQLAWYDTEALRLVRVEYFDRREAHLKTLEATGWERSESGHWRARHMAMDNHRTGRRTELHWSPHAFATGLAEADFTTTALRRVR